jgi:hypothetical protein
VLAGVVAFGGAGPEEEAAVDGWMEQKGGWLVCCLFVCCWGNGEGKGGGYGSGFGALRRGRSFRVCISVDMRLAL